MKADGISYSFTMSYKGFNLYYSATVYILLQIPNSMQSARQFVTRLIPAALARYGTGDGVRFHARLHTATIVFKLCFITNIKVLKKQINKMEMRTTKMKYNVITKFRQKLPNGVSSFTDVIECNGCLCANGDSRQQSGNERSYVAVLNDLNFS